MMAISEFPRCSAYLRGMGVKLSDPEMQDKHFAWLLGDAAFKESELREIGAEGLSSTDWGFLLPAMENALRDRNRTSKASNTPKASKESRNRLLGMMCWCGLKGSTFKEDSEVVFVASILWPKAVKSADMGLEDALRAVSKLTKKERSYLVRENYHRVPPKFSARPDLVTGNEGAGA